jgi:hypothetical protein
MNNLMRDPVYLGFIRTRVCSFCFSTPVEPHHVFKHFPQIGGGGVGLKGSDYLAVPACRRCHSDIHSGALRVERVQLLELLIINLVCFVADRKSSYLSSSDHA